MASHTSEKSYQCSLCEESFSRIDSLKTHMEKHSNKETLTCNICDKKCSTNGNLKQHLKTHTSEKLYQCNLCENKYSTNSNLKQHLKTHNSEKPYQCNLCENTFSTNGSLKRHIKIHTSEKPYQCNLCEKSFSRSHDLKRHMTTHTSELAYQCSLCDKSFANNSILKKHMTTHTSELLYQCNICDKSFANNSVLKTHMVTHTGENSYQFSQPSESFCVKSNDLGHTFHECRQCDKAFTQINMCSDNEMETICDINVLHNQVHSENDSKHSNKPENIFCSNSYINKSCECRQCEKAFAHIEMCYITEKPDTCDGVVFKNLSLDDSKTFNGIKFKNYPENNLCYVNSTINGLLNCKSLMHLVNSNVNCEIMNEIRYWVNLSELSHSTETLRELVINKGKVLFSNKVQSDPAEFIQCLFDISKPLEKLFQFNCIYSYKCLGDGCSDITYSTDININGLQECMEADINICGLQECMEDISLSSILQNNRVAYVHSYCDKCNKDCDKIKTEIIKSLPEILMVQLKRFGLTEVDGVEHSYKLHNDIEPDKELIINNTKYFLRSIITHLGEATNQGHYIAAFIDGSGAHIECNDTKIGKVVPPMNGYIFFYEKESPMQHQGSINITVNQSLERNYNCKMCSIPFSSRESFRHHLRKHTGKKTYKCSYCEKAFTSNGSLLCHMRTHTVEKPYKCSTCDKAFTNKEYFITHQRSHTGERPYQCHSCDKAYANKISLEGHQRTHIDEKPYHCSHCDQSFVYKKYFLNHQKTHTGEGEKPYKCSNCDRSFTYKKYFITHQRSHTGEKPYKCCSCDKAYTNQMSLDGHQRTHTGEKPYQCSHCDQSFVYKKYFLNHQKAHTGDGENPYKCSTCDKSYLKKTSLTIHQRTHSLKQKDENIELLTMGNTSKSITDHVIGKIGDVRVSDSLEDVKLEMLNEIKENKPFLSLTKENKAIKFGVKLKKDLKGFKMDDICSICEESWYDKKFCPDLGICNRCRQEKFKDIECYTYSKQNNMIPGPQPLCLKVLNDVEKAAIKLIKPSIHIYKRKGGGVGFSGNCISFAQNIDSFAKSLPWPVKDLPIIIIQSANDSKERKFFASARKIRNALVWLKDHHPDYRHIDVNESLLAEYPEHGGYLNGIRKIIEPTKESTTVINEPSNDDVLLQAMLDVEEQGDMPRPESIVPSAIQRDEIDNMVKKAINELDNSIAWPEMGLLPENEFKPGWFRRTFPHLFPDGEGDITCSRLGKTVSLSAWVEHLLKVSRRFANDSLFVMVATNIMQKHQAITLGNLYAERQLSDVTSKDLKEMLEKGDYSVLKSLYCFSKDVKGSQQSFNQYASKSINFLRHIKIDSHNKKMFNIFLTFSVADLHERVLHEKLPGSEAYINKTVVKDLNLITDCSDKSNYIDEKTDYLLRLDAVNKNSDIVNAYLIKKVDLIWKLVLKPVFGGEDFIKRFEFQHRGSIHCHMVMSSKYGPSCAEMELAMTKLPVMSDCKNQKEVEEARITTEGIQKARNKMEKFNSIITGISAVHPEVDPVKWPAPWGQNVYKPSNDVLRTDFENFIEDPQKLYDYYTFQINRFMLHKCKMGFCKDIKRVKYEKVLGPDHKVRIGPDGKEMKERTYPCRFDFPKDILGFNFESNESGKIEKICSDLDGSGNLKINGSFHDGEKLTLLRNHPDLVTHIPELLIIWGANCDQKTITSYDQLINYLLKYLMKNESQSDFFTNIARTVTDKIDDEAPIRKAAQKILLNSVGQRDMSVNECMLICHNQPSVEFSKSPRVVNLKGSIKFKDTVASNNEILAEKTNWQEAYWQRESCPGYKQLCKDYPSKFKYSKHPKYISLREFVVNFTMKWKYRPANVFPHFIPTFRYIVHKGKPNYERYCQNLLLMDKPGCTLDNVGKEFDSCEAELFDFVMFSEYCPQLLKDEFLKSQKITSETTKEKSIEGDAFDELYIDINPVDENAPKDDWMDLYSFGLEFGQDSPQERGDVEEDDYVVKHNENEAYDWKSDFEEAGLTRSDLNEAPVFIDYQKRVATLTINEQCMAEPGKLNFKQTKAYDFICTWIEMKKKDPENTNPIYLNISGRAGCGKSYFLNCVAQIALEIYGCPFLQKAAPTGTAAFLIGGSTLHAMFMIPVQKSSPSKELPDLSGESLRNLQQVFHGCEILVIDEKSMIGLYTLYIIDKRLREIKPQKSMFPFGGISIVLMGDFAQHPPMGDVPMFTSKPELSHYQYIGKALFDMFEKTVIFDEIMRQKGDDQKHFREILDRLAKGEFTRDDWYFLKTREIYGDGNLSENEIKEFFNKGVMLCALNKHLIAFNMKKIKALGTPIAAIKSINSSSTVAALSSSKAHGLPSQVWLARECHVTITTNLWKEAGLTNGANGVIKFIVYEGNTRPPALPSLVIVQVPQYIGPSYKNLDKCVPIVPIRREWYKGKTLCWREMVPLKPAYAMSIHSSQGRTMDRVIINLGPTEFANGLTYTALSRCRKIEHLSFYPMKDFTRFSQIKRAQIFKDRLEHDKKERESDVMFGIDK